MVGPRGLGLPPLVRWPRARWTAPASLSCRLSSARLAGLPSLLTFGEPLFTFRKLPSALYREGSALPPLAPGATPLLRAIGGAELNTAIAVANLTGQPGAVAYVSVLPHGALGDEVVRTANSAGVSTSALHRSQSCDVLGTLHVVDADGGGPRPLYQRHSSAFCTTVNASTHDWATLLNGPRWLHLTGITPALGSGPRAAWDSALSTAAESILRAKTLGLLPLRVSLDLNHRPALGSLEDLWAAVIPHLSTLTMLVVSEDNLRALAEREGVELHSTDALSSHPDPIALLARMREKWNVPLLACCFKRPLSSESPATTSTAEFAADVPLAQGHPYSPWVQRVKDTTQGGAGVRRWSAIAFPGGVTGTAAIPTEHSPVEALGGGDAWIAGFIHAALNEPSVEAAVQAVVLDADKASRSASPPDCTPGTNFSDLANDATWGPDDFSSPLSLLGGQALDVASSLQMGARRGDLLAGLQMASLGDLSGVGAETLSAAEAAWVGVPARLGAGFPTPAARAEAMARLAVDKARIAEQAAAGTWAAMVEATSDVAGASAAAAAATEAAMLVRVRTRAEDEIFQRLQECGVVPVVTIDQAEQAIPVAHALLAGGIDAMELVLRTPAAEQGLALVSANVPSMLVGAGTVLSAAQAERASAAGARFLVSPGTSAPVVRYASNAQLPIIPGVATATEVETALALGLTYLKFFPAVPMGGLAMIKALSAPFSHVRWMPTGGISPTNLADFLMHKQVFAAGGTWIVPKDALAKRDYARIETLATEASRVAMKHKQKG